MMASASGFETFQCHAIVVGALTRKEEPTTALYGWSVEKHSDSAAMLRPVVPSL